MTVANDIRYALRGIRLRPGWAIAAILTLALGIGANATMFAVVDRLLVRGPAHIADPKRLMRIGLDYEAGNGSRFTMTSTSFPVFDDLQRSAHSFQGFAAVANRDMVLGSGADARSVPASQVSGGYFALSGTRPTVGRFFGAEEDQAAEAVAVISHAFWRREYGGSREALRAEITLDHVPYRVIGVTPPDFTGDLVEPSDVWIPLQAAMADQPGGWHTERNMRLIRILGRLADGAHPAAAAEEAALVVRRGMEGSPGADPTLRVVLDPVAPGWRDVGRASTQGRIALWVAAMSVVVLLIAVVNVANLMLFRAEGRRREVAVRLAMGAARGDLTRQLLVESLVLASLGGLAALLVAAWGSEVTRALLMPNLAGAERLVSFRLLAITAGGTLAAGLLAALVPALRAGRASVADDLRSGSGAGTSSRAPALFLVAQGALCTLLLVGAGLFLLSLHRVRTQDFGFRAEGVLLATMRFPNSVPGATQDALYRQAEETVRRMPGVEAASIVQAVPFGGHNVPPIAVPGREDFPDLNQQAPFLNAATPHFFRALGMSLLEGRNFTDADREGAELVVIVNQAMAQGLWPGESAVGRCIRIGFVPGVPPTGIHASPTLPCRTIVGVVNNARPRSIREEAGQARMMYYVPFGQVPKPWFAEGPEVWGLLVRTAHAGIMAAPLQRTLQSFAPDLPFAEIEPLQDVLDRQMRPWLLGASMFTLFGLLALGLAAVGLYGVRAYSVARRTQEIGVRVALGATLGRVMRLILFEGLRVSLAGVAVGVLGALLLARFIEPLLFETAATDVRIFVAVGAALAAVALLASASPAWRAARVDPSVALRAE